MNFYIDVIIPLAINNTFTYAISQEEYDLLQPGMRVAVPFGKSKIYTGIVAKIHQQHPEIYTPKFIETILDQSPIVSKLQLAFWEWISSYYLCSLGEVMRAALPGIFLLESETVIQRNNQHDTIELANQLSDEQFLVLEALEKQSQLKIKEVGQLLGKKNVLPILQEMAQKKYILLEQEIFEQYKPKLIKYIRLSESYENPQAMNAMLEELGRAHKQKEIVMQFFTLKAQSNKPISRKKLKEKAQASDASLNALVDKGFLEEYTLQIDRVKNQNQIAQQLIDLSAEQQAALNQIEANFKASKPVLFHGITSSGKTEVYMKLIDKQVKKGKQVLFLVPEIALTTQLIKRLEAYFGQEVMVYHSKYSQQERFETYLHIYNQTKGKIIVGTRSALLLPFQDLGLILVDESHENSFKQLNPAPRYQARDAAVVLSHLCKASIVLGTATPSIESYYNAQRDKYALVSLKKRYGQVIPPEIHLINLKEKYKRNQMKGHFSDVLIEAIEQTILAGKQVILFQNRRGYSPTLECHTCGHSPHCPNCDVSLTFHKHNNSLRCHYCGYHIAMQKACMACGSSEVSTKGFGTEQIETELNTLLPKARVARMDLDTTRGKNAYDKILDKFEQHSIDILVGTQMLTKGLDFRNVDLVGVMNADNLLNFPDFRAHERSFQMLVQVAGRAGRTAKQGKVLIQTFNPHHQILQQVTTNSYEDMFKEQVYERKNFKYPPFYRLIKITCKQRDYNAVEEASLWLSEALRQGLRDNVLGPEFPAVARVRNEYRKNIIVKIPMNYSVKKTKDFILKVKKSYESIGKFRKVKLTIDVDPV
ncbi:primosomal protein N' [Mesonia sediminis]|uniref:Replication restart protein PriA n=1 Tax=Mesonia sediminis TaxID=1703946 RepID=A0ABW5SFH6_9FLAO